MTFGRTAEGGVLVSLDEFETGMLVHLFTQVLMMVEPDETGTAAADPEADALAAMVGIGTATHVPLDPALARLFPDAYQGDAIAAGDFRRFTEDRLRRRKIEHATVALEVLERIAQDHESGTPGPLELTGDEVAAWLGALNDLRLVLGTRLGVEDDDDPDEWLAGPEADTYRLYHWLGFVQEDLLAALGAGPG